MVKRLGKVSASLMLSRTICARERAALVIRVGRRMVLPASATPIRTQIAPMRLPLFTTALLRTLLNCSEELIAKGHTFTSDTDTECIAHLVEENYHGDLFEAVRVVSNSLSGAYGLAVMAPRSSWAKSW